MPRSASATGGRASDVLCQRGPRLTMRRKQNLLLGALAEVIMAVLISLVAVIMYVVGGHRGLSA